MWSVDIDDAPFFGIGIWWTVMGYLSRIKMTMGRKGSGKEIRHSKEQYEIKKDAKVCREFNTCLMDIMV